MITKLMISIIYLDINNYKVYRTYRILYIIYAELNLNHRYIYLYRAQ